MTKQLRFGMSCVAAALLLTGCVLQSKEPNFAEEQGVALPEQLGGKFTSESFSKGGWKAEDGVISFQATGKHYVASNSTSPDTVDVLFVKLGQDEWVMQAAEKDKPSAYMLAEARDNTVLLQPLLCDELKKQEELAKTLRFEGNDCFLEAKMDLAAFRAIKAKLDPAKMRLVPVK